MKNRIIILILLVTLMMWLIPQKVTDSTEYMEFPRGAGLEEIRLQQTKLLAEALEVQRKAKLEQYKNDLRTRAEKLVGKKQGQCVVAVRNFLRIGRDQIQGMAKNLRTNSSTPEIGAIIKIRDNHVGAVIDVWQGVITYYDSNGYSITGPLAEVAAIRTIAINSPKIAGYKIIK